MIDYDLRLLPAFIALADELHFGRAAERLHVGQPALSQQLVRLERQLGVRLVERHSRRVVLTPSGHAFLASARSAVVLARSAADAARRARADRVAFRVGIDIDMPLDLVRSVRRFGSGRDDFDLRVVIAQQDDLLAALDRAELDAAVVWAGRPSVHPSSSSPLTSVSIHGVVRRADAPADGDRLSRAALLDRRLAIYQPTQHTRPFYDFLLDACSVDGRIPCVVHVRAVDDAQEAMLDAVERDGGFTICVEGQLDTVRRPALVALPFEPGIAADVVVRWHGAGRPEVVDALARRLRGAD